MIKVVDKVLRFGEGKKLRQLEAAVASVAAWESEIAPLSDEALRGKTDEFKKRLADGETLDDIMPEAFAVAREAAKRATGMRPFDVQVMGAVVLHQGSIAEMKTGEGKTLVATMPVYLNALAGRGVHVVTVNDYLASRDATWMGPVYEFLGLTVAALQNNMEGDSRRQAYLADITYGTNTEFGFDYLRDNMVLRTDQQVAARPLLLHRRRGGLHPHRRGAHPAHHLRSRRAGRQDLLRLRQDRPQADGRAKTRTTRSTRRSAPWPSPRRAWSASSESSASRTSTKTCRASSSTTSCRR